MMKTKDIHVEGIGTLMFAIKNEDGRLCYVRSDRDEVDEKYRSLSWRRQEDVKVVRVAVLELEDPTQ